MDKPLLFSQRFEIAKLDNLQGKKRPGFDFTLKVKWNAEKDDEDEPATGYVCIDDVLLYFPLTSSFRILLAVTMNGPSSVSSSLMVMLM